MRIEVAESPQGLPAEEYDRLLLNSDLAMFYHSLKYLKLLSSFVEGAPIIILCYDNGELAGVLPAFVKRNRNTGTVLNSLPFFGSHGGVVIRKDIERGRVTEVYRCILKHLKEVVFSEEDVTVSTVITSPHEKVLDLYRQLLSPQYSENRTTQMLAIPEVATEQELIGTFEKRCRWAIMKAAKNHVLVRNLNYFEAAMIDRLYEMQVENALRAGASAKPKAFFKNIDEFFEIHRDYDVYVAEYRDDIVAALLVFYFGRFAEYFVPAVKPEYRSLNPMNLIILKAMVNARRRGLRIWNFGGTRETMSGVYMFKRSFGARDYAYYYFTSVLSDASSLLELTATEMRTAYEWFYVIPYAVLRT
jgi:hypothetical protein